MDKSILQDIIVILPSILCFCAIIKVVLLTKENTLLARQLTQTTVALQKNSKYCQELKNQREKLSDFQSSLSEAAITTNLQQPRLKSAQTAVTPKNSEIAPEKYSFVHSLVEKGIKPKEISSILSISSHEVQQIIKLRSIALGS